MCSTLGRRRISRNYSVTHQIGLSLATIASAICLFLCSSAVAQQTQLTPCIQNNLLEGLSPNATQSDPHSVTLSQQPYAADRVRPTVASIMSIPSTPEEYAAIFGPKPTARQFETVLDRRKALINAGVADVKDYGGNSYLCRLERFFSESPDSFVAVIGHNDEGRFAFASGQTASLVYISELVLARTLSCGIMREFSCSGISECCRDQ